MAFVEKTLSDCMEEDRPLGKGAMSRLVKPGLGGLRLPSPEGAKRGPEGPRNNQAQRCRPAWPQPPGQVKEPILPTAFFGRC